MKFSIYNYKKRKTGNIYISDSRQKMRLEISGEDLTKFLQSLNIVFKNNDYFLISNKISFPKHYKSKKQVKNNYFELYQKKFDNKGKIVFIKLNEQKEQELASIQEEIKMVESAGVGK